jgi:hypothetical protein
VGCPYTPNMGRIDIILPDDVENKLRMEVGRRMGAKRGNLTEAIIQAVNAWMEKDAELKVKRK